MKHWNTISRSWMLGALLALGLAGTPALAAPNTNTAGSPPGDVTTTDLTGADWDVKSENSVCGVSTARQITNPAKVDYEKLMSATSEMKELEREGIKRDSARGQTLVIKARDKVRRASKAVMDEKGHCSVWKKIRHKKGRTVADITSSVEAKLGS